MEYLFITLKTRERGNFDLKIPSFVTVRELIRMFAASLEIYITPESRIQAEPLGRLLDNDRTLAAEGIGNGALLTLL